MPERRPRTALRALASPIQMAEAALTMGLLRPTSAGRAAPKPQTAAVHGHRWIDYREFQESK
jgi:hypothetical protein